MLLLDYLRRERERIAEGLAAEQEAQDMLAALGELGVEPTEGT